MILVIGNKNYSSWSLRPWIAMKVLGLRFDEKRIPLYGPGAKEEILLESPAGKVPILIDGATRVWDSLAILEYLAEKTGRLWPAEPAVRIDSVCSQTSSVMSNAAASDTRKWGSVSGRCSCSTRNGSSASIVTTHGEIDVAKLFARNGPRG